MFKEKNYLVYKILVLLIFGLSNSDLSTVLYPICLQLHMNFESYQAAVQSFERGFMQICKGFVVQWVSH